MSRGLAWSDSPGDNTRMSFSDFDLRGALEAFGLQEERAADMFAEVEPLVPSEWLRAWLDEFVPGELGVSSEKARSEFVIAPILVEARRRSAGPANVLSGVTLDVDRARGLTGFCDFLIARSKKLYHLRGPLVAVVEAKREDLIAGLGQCVASMVALREFNARDGLDIPVIYGCVSSGSNWKFLRLAKDQLEIDSREYYLRDVGKIIAIIVHVLGNGATVV